MLFPETNVMWNRYDVQTFARQYRHNTFDFSHQNTSNSIHTYNSAYQPGGTCSILTNNLVRRFHSSDTDQTFGQWTIMTINIKQNRKLSIICCYQVCDQTSNSVGPKTAFNQQWSILKQQGNPYPHPRKQFITDLDKTLSQLRNKGHSIVLAGDFNTTVGEQPFGLDMILNKYSLIDSIQYLHGEYECSTYARGTKCIDYIFASTDLLPAIKGGGIPLLDAITSSDHHAIFIDVHIPSCLESELSCLL